MDTPELRRSALERKDRDELTTIAASLDLKVPSRARKAEIVDLIITAVTTDGADESADASAAAAAQEGADVTQADGEAAEEFDFGEVTTKEASSGGGRRDAKGGDDSDNGAANEEPGPGNRRQRRRGRGRDHQEPWDGEPVRVEGVLDLRDDGYGFLRVSGWKASKEDAYVSVKQVRANNLRKGDHLVGSSRPANRNEKNPALLTLEEVNGQAPDEGAERVSFDDLVPVHSEERVTLNRSDDQSVSARIIDLLAPIGKGSRALVAGPSGSGTTTVLRDICLSIEANEPDVHLITMLIDTRPEEVTDFRRAIVGELAASPMDRPADEHVAVAEMSIERAKRLAEVGKDVVIVVDNLTALARALQQGGNSNRNQVGDLDANSIHLAKRFFGAGRKIEDGGSITVVAGLRVDPSSAVDRLLTEIFESAATAVITMSGEAARRGVYPAIDVQATSSRAPESLVGEERARSIHELRGRLASVGDEGGVLGALDMLSSRIANGDSDDAILGG